MSNDAVSQGSHQGTETDERKARLSLLARAPHDTLLQLWNAWCAAKGMPRHDVVRGPQIGTVMVRGRAGGTGAAFNLGEITVTRCTVRLGCGTVGHGHVQGRNADAARATALIDALFEGGDASGIEETILAPLRETSLARAAERAARAAATKVEFFTLVRGEA
ncbi:MAG: phosphonate C-P lyase system protein PhnG [Pseudomonadota bacterium]